VCAADDVFAIAKLLVHYRVATRYEFGLGLRTADKMTLFISKIRENGHRHEIFKIDHHGCEIMPLLHCIHKKAREFLA